MHAIPKPVPEVLLAASALILAGCAGSQVGLVANEGRDRVSAFDPASDTPQGGVAIARSSIQHYVMAIDPLAGAGYIATDGAPTIRTVSLDNLPPRVVDTFQAGHRVNELATFPKDRALLLMAGGVDNGEGVVSTITANGNEIDRLTLGQDVWPLAMAACDDGRSLLVGVGTTPPEVRKLSIASDGTISATGNSYTAQLGTALSDVICAPGAQSGAAVTSALQATPVAGSASAYLESFDLQSMTGQDSVALTGRHALSAVFSPNGQTVFAHSGLNTRFGQSYIDKFGHVPGQGTFGTRSSTAAAPVGVGGRSTLALDASGSKLYAPDLNDDRLQVFDTGTLSLVGSVSGNLDAPVAVVTAEQ